MLIEKKLKLLFLGTYTTLVCLHIYSALNHQLFGDEAFYWFESQHLAWSYAELPGWTQWTIAFSQWLLPQHEFTVRLPGLLAAWCLPWLGMSMATKLARLEQQYIWQTGLLLMSIPLLAVAGFMAIPDIWLTFIGTLSIWTFIHAIKTSKTSRYLLLGLVLAVGINVHIRFWIMALLAGVVIFWQFRHQKDVIRKLLVFSFPIMMLGFIPILLFNVEHDFALLNFQLSDRHPWEFQASHFNFFPTQTVVASPLVFLLFWVTIFQVKSLNQLQRTLIFIALFHWLIYAFIGFFSDNLRFNAHWTIFSYFLLLIVAGSNVRNNALKLWSIITGVILSIALTCTLIYALHFVQPVSKLNAQMTENFRGWRELSVKTNAIKEAGSYDFIVVDHFMTLAELKFYSEPASKIISLTHPANLKHGREKQLEIMEYLQDNTSDNGLLVVEHSALKLEQMIVFYLAACKTLNGIELIDSFDYSQGIKTYYYFTTGQGQCELPPISYFQPEKNQISGWVIADKTNPPSILLHTESTQSRFKYQTKPLGNNNMFQALDDKQYHLIEFKFDSTSTQSAYQMQFNFADLSVMSSRIYPE